MKTVRDIPEGRQNRSMGLLLREQDPLYRFLPDVGPAAKDCLRNDGFAYGHRPGDVRNREELSV